MGMSFMHSGVVPLPYESELLVKKQLPHAHVLLVQYKATYAMGFEGKKILVYKGQFKEVSSRDPHFDDSEYETYSPIARFEPTTEGWSLAVETAKLIKP